MSTAASRFQAYLVENARCAGVHREIGPFVVLIDPEDAGPRRNYATPVSGAAIRPDDIGALVSAFIQAERRPFLEYVEDVFELADGFAGQRRGELFLMAFPQEVGIYERAGFAVVATIAHLSHPPA